MPDPDPTPADGPARDSRVAPGSGPPGEEVGAGSSETDDIPRGVFSNYLVARNKINYIQGKMRRQYACIFCEIVKENPAVPAHVVFRDEFLFCSLNLFPYNAGHLLVVPVEHVESLREFSPGELTRLFTFVQASQQVLLQTLSPTGFNLGVNEGANSGQSIKHFHVHLVPRFPNELGFMDVAASTRTLPISLDQVTRRLQPGFRRIQLAGTYYTFAEAS